MYCSWNNIQEKLCYYINLHWSCHSPALSPCTYSSTVVWSSASVLANLSLRCLHSSAILSSSCCSSFKPAADLLSAWFFWWWKTHIFIVRFQYRDFFYPRPLAFVMNCTLKERCGHYLCFLFPSYFIKPLTHYEFQVFMRPACLFLFFSPWKCAFVLSLANFTSNQ